MIYHSQRNYPLALEMYQNALDILIPTLGENHPDIANILNNIGAVYSNLGDERKALEMYQDAMKIWESIYGSDHPYIASSLNNIGTSYFRIGDFVKALEMYQKALNIRLNAYGDIHSDVADSYANIGTLYHYQEDYVNALTMFQKAWKLRSAIFGEDHPYAVQTYSKLGVIYYTALAEGTELPGYAAFMNTTVLVCTTTDNDSPAITAGMKGEYYVLEYEDWKVDSDSNFFVTLSNFQGKPKTIVVMQRGEISRLHFENTIGVQFDFKYIGEDGKQNIINIYKEWCENNNLNNTSN